MCGLVGVAGTLDKKSKDIFVELLKINALRGEDSTGLAGIDYQGEAHVAREVGPPAELFALKSTDAAINKATRVLIGHGRYKTMGAAARYNAHPFDFKNVVGVHNGTLQPFSVKKLKNHQYFDTDSEAIFDDIDERMIDNVTPDMAIKQTVALLDGAWALVMFTKKDKRLRMVKNKERPMFYCYSADLKHMYWASEVWMLYGVLARNGVEIHDKPIVLSDDMLHTWKIPDYNDKFEKPTKQSCEGYAWSRPFQKDTTVRHGTNSRTSSIDPVTQEPKPLEEVKFLGKPLLDPIKEMSPHKKGGFRPPYKAPNGDQLTKEQFEEHVKEAGECAYCEHVPTYGEDALILKDDPRGKPQILCKKCVTDPQILSICRGMV